MGLQEGGGERDGKALRLSRDKKRTPMMQLSVCSCFLARRGCQVVNSMHQQGQIISDTSLAKVVHYCACMWARHTKTSVKSAKRDPTSAFYGFSSLFIGLVAWRLDVSCLVRTMVDSPASSSRIGLTFLHMYLPFTTAVVNCIFSSSHDMV